MEAIQTKTREKLFYRVVVTDKNGKIISIQEEEAHSFLVQYNRLWAACFNYVATTVKDTGGTDRSITPTIATFRVTATINQVTRGIRVGTGDTAVAVGDYALETAIANGTGGGQMKHQAMVIPTDITVSDPDCTFELKRIINNASGGSITVKEIALYASMDNTYFGCIARDVLGVPVAVPIGGTITVIYTWKITE